MATTSSAAFGRTPIINELSNCRRISVRDVVALFFVAMVPIAVYSASLKAALDIRQDDHRIIFAGSDNPLHQQVFSAPIEPTVGFYLFIDATELGRFRPVSAALEAVLPRILGTDPFLWHLAVLLLASAIAVALFLVGYHIGGSWVEGTALALLVTLAPDPGPAKVWYMMSVRAEAVGTLLVLGAVLASIRAAGPFGRFRHDVVGLILMAAAVLTKESFGLLLPALLAIRVALPIHSGQVSEWRAVPRLGPVVRGYLAIGVLYAVAIGATLAVSPRESYGTRSLHDWGQLLNGFALTLSHVPQQAAWFGPTLLAIMAVSHKCGFTNFLREFRIPFLVAAAWVIPQIVLYSLRGGMWDHYWLPCILGFAGLNIWGLRALRRRNLTLAYSCAFLLLGIWAANGVRVNISAVENHVQRTLLRDDVLTGLISILPQRGRVAIVADVNAHSEYAFSWVFFIGDRGRPDTQILLYDTGSAEAKGFSKYFLFPENPSFDQVRACQLDAIVFLDRPLQEDLAWNRWFDAECFTMRSFTRAQNYWSLRKLGRDQQQVSLEAGFNKKLFR